MVYAAFATALALLPGAIAMALSVSDFEIVVGSLHWGEEAVGVLPLVVQ
jgi:hypothetical protein